MSTLAWTCLVCRESDVLAQAQARRSAAGILDSLRRESPRIVWQEECETGGEEEGVKQEQRPDVPPQ